MPHSYENTKNNFSSFDEFKEVATKTLHEVYGREKPFDVIDFSYNETHYRAVGYRDGEELPPEQQEGEPLQAEVVVELTAEEAADLEAKVKSGHMSFEAAAAFGLKEIDGVPVLEAAKNALRNPDAPVGRVEVSKGIVKIGEATASTAAADLADASGVDISKVEGTGKDGIIKLGDVKDYIANNAPAQENADGNGNEQSDA
jgi:pyruvate/2-oxoglutarate dehydrogenase complex dihydrolipoamide acyltransferase (E2) component